MSHVKNEADESLASASVDLRRIYPSLVNPVLSPWRVLSDWVAAASFAEGLCP